MTKLLILVKICYKLLYVIQGVENIINNFLASHGNGIMSNISELNVWKLLHPSYQLYWASVDTRVNTKKDLKAW